MMKAAPAAYRGAQTQAIARATGLPRIVAGALGLIARRPIMAGLAVAGLGVHMMVKSFKPAGDGAYLDAAARDRADTAAPAAKAPTAPTAPHADRNARADYQDQWTDKNGKQYTRRDMSVRGAG